MSADKAAEQLLAEETAFQARTEVKKAKKQRQKAKKQQAQQEQQVAALQEQEEEQDRQGQPSGLAAKAGGYCASSA